MAQTLYNTHSVHYPREIVNAGRYLSIGGPVEYLTELYESGYFMRDLENTPDSGIQDMIAHMENGGDARDFFRQELSEL